VWLPKQSRWAWIRFALPRAVVKLAEEMLQDPASAAAWEKALENEEFAGDYRARWLWWYKRTKYWDDSVGLMPVMRLMSATQFDSVPWSGPYETR